MIIALAPHAEVQHAQRLERLAQRRGGTGRHLVQHLGDVLAAGRARRLGIAGGEIEHCVKAHAHGLVIIVLFGRIVRVDLSQHGIEALGDDLFIVRGQIAHAPLLVDIVLIGNVLPFLVGEHNGQIGQRAREGNILALQNHGLLTFKEGLQPERHALIVLQFAFAIHGRIDGHFAPVSMMRLIGDDQLAQRLDAFGHDIRPSFFMAFILFPKTFLNDECSSYYIQMLSFILTIPIIPRFSDLKRADSKKIAGLYG